MEQSNWGKDHMAVKIKVQLSSNGLIRQPASENAFFFFHLLHPLPLKNPLICAWYGVVIVSWIKVPWLIESKTSPPTPQSIKRDSEKLQELTMRAVLRLFLAWGNGDKATWILQWDKWGSWVLVYFAHPVLEQFAGTLFLDLEVSHRIPGNWVLKAQLVSVSLLLPFF